MIIAVFSVITMFSTTGCAVFDTLENVELLIEPETESEYYLYVPSAYNPDRDYPLIVTCHGTPPWDTASLQIKRWKSLAESKRFIVAAPKLIGTRGDITPSAEKQIARQKQDERTILSVVNHQRGARKIPADRVFLTGWSGGGYAVLYTGLRNPDVFRALSVRQGNFDERFVRPTLHKLDPYQPIHILYSAVDPLREQGKDSIAWLRDQQMFVSQEVTTGSHKRHPEEAYAFFRRCVQQYAWIQVRAHDVAEDRPLTTRLSVTASPPAQTYVWDFGDGTKSKVASPEHTFAAPGTYDVKVALDLGLDEPELRTVTVTVPRRRAGTVVHAPDDPR